MDPFSTARSTTCRPFASPASAADSVTFGGLAPGGVGAVDYGERFAAGSFIAGDENRLSLASALLLLHEAARSRTGAEDGDENPPHRADSPESFGPSVSYGPLVLYGSSGTGKTLLCDVLVDEWRRRLPEHRIVRLEGTEFARRYAQAVDADEIERFRTDLRGADLFVLEDVQRLGTKQPAQYELLHTLDALEARGAYVALTLDVPPPQLSHLPAGLVSRLSAGLVVGTAPPSAATRRAIAGRFAAARRWTVDAKALDLLAADLETGVPELLGTMATLEATARAEGTTLDAAAVRRYLDRRAIETAPTLKAVAEAAARQFGLTMGDLKSGSRRKTAVAARDAAVFLARRLTNKTLQEIGAYFGGRDHTTILHSIRKLETALQTDATTRQMLDALRSRLAKTGPLAES